MADDFLEEQLKRIRQLTEQMSHVRSRAAELSEEVNRDREMARRSPLHEVRDFRSLSSIGHMPDHVEDHGGRSAVRAATRRRK